MAYDIRAIPAAEQIRQYVVVRLQELNNIFTDLLYYKDMDKFHQPKISAFRSSLISFYNFLRPKIMGYIIDLEKKSSDDDMNKSIAEDYKTLIAIMDGYTKRPSTFEEPEMIEVYKYLLQFTEDYQLTATQMQREGI